MKEYDPKKPTTHEYAQVKEDGWFITITKNAVGMITVKSSTDKSVSVDHCAFMLLIHRYVPNNTVIHGELIAPNQPASAVSHHLANKTPLELRVFAVPVLSSRNIAWWDLQLVKDLVDTWGLYYCQYFHWDKSVDYATLATKMHVEGFVFKDCNYDPSTERKIKPVLTIELKVVGFTEGNGKHLGFVGSLICADGTDTVVAKAGGFADCVRWNIDEDDDLGRICEVAYQYVGAKGKLRHPRFIRWRDDKKVAQVLL